MKTMRLAMAIPSLILVTILLANVTQLQASSLHHVTLCTSPDRPWKLTGELSFTVGKWGSTTFECGSKWISISEGDKVKIIIKTDKGGIWIDSYDGWLNIYNVKIKKLIVNGKQVCSDEEISGLNTRARLDSLISTLKLSVKDSGWTYLKVDGNVVINGNDDSDIKVYDLTIIPKSVDLNIDLDGRYLDGGTSKVLVNGEEVPIQTFSMLFIALGLVAALALKRGLSSNRVGSHLPTSNNRRLKNIVLAS